MIQRRSSRMSMRSNLTAGNLPWMDWGSTASQWFLGRFRLILMSENGGIREAWLMISKQETLLSIRCTFIRMWRNLKSFTPRKYVNSKPFFWLESQAYGLQVAIQAFFSIKMQKNGYFEISKIDSIFVKVINFRLWKISEKRLFTARTPWRKHSKTPQGISEWLDSAAPNA